MKNILDGLLKWTLLALVAMGVYIHNDLKASVDKNGEEDKKTSVEIIKTQKDVVVLQTQYSTIQEQLKGISTDLKRLLEKDK